MGAKSKKKSDAVDRPTENTGESLLLHRLLGDETEEMPQVEAVEELISPETLRAQHEEERTYAELVAGGSFETMREQNLRRDRRRRAGYVFLSLAICLVILVGFSAVYLRVKTVEVEGNVSYTAEQIEAASGIKKGDNLYTVSKQVVMNRILSAFPYIEKIQIDRKIPDRMILIVQESQPSYYFELCGEYFVLSEDFRILERNQSREDLLARYPALIQIVTMEISSAIVGNFLRFRSSESNLYAQNMLKTFRDCALISHIDAINFKNQYDIFFVYEGRFRVEIGSMDNLDTKITLASAILKSIDSTKRGTLNVENDQAYVILNHDVNLE